MASPHVLSDIRRYSSYESTVVPYASIRSAAMHFLVTREANRSHGVVLPDEVVAIGLNDMVQTIEDSLAHPKRRRKWSAKSASGAK